MDNTCMYILNDQGGSVMEVVVDVAPTLRAQDHGHPPLVLTYDAIGNGACHTLSGNAERTEVIMRYRNISGTLNPGAHVGSYNRNRIVRRLTPTECERLQGYPDGWTDIGDWTDRKGKKHKAADTPRYKALGNSIAVGYANNGSGFWMWLMKRISAQYERNATLGSLFDGIGGFPLAWENYNGKGSAVWASEIDEFCIAVTKKHFGEA